MWFFLHLLRRNSSHGGNYATVRFSNRSSTSASDSVCHCLRHKSGAIECRIQHILQGAREPTISRFTTHRSKPRESDRRPRRHEYRNCYARWFWKSIPVAPVEPLISAGKTTCLAIVLGNTCRNMRYGIKLSLVERCIGRTHIVRALTL